MNHKKKILIVEDEVEFAKMVKLRLQSVGFEVSLASDIQVGTQKMME